ncbi:MAG: translation elongation factor 4 [Patescibacteria group bacterium]
MDNIRNFVIISHIDHGKSTLADRFLELTGTVPKRKMHAQFLDSMELERERGITIKMQPVRMAYTLNAKPFILNLIDTPGHVDFAYEVSRALAAVEGAILLVDASQGIEAQTISVLDMAKNLNLVIIPAVNKIDLPTARIGETKEQIRKILNLAGREIFEISGKTGQGVEKLLEAVVRLVPSPKPAGSDRLGALIFDSEYSPHQGVIAYVRVFSGEIKKGDELLLLVAKEKFVNQEVGIFRPERAPARALKDGEIGYIATNLKNPEAVKVGDTVTLSGKPASALTGYHEAQPAVWTSAYPLSEEDYDDFKKAVLRLRLNDTSFSYEEESSPVLGRGMRLGFLGMLHLEIGLERLRREFGVKTIAASPTVAFQVVLKNKSEKTVYVPAEFPEDGEIAEIKEQWVNLDIISPQKELSQIFKILQKHSGRILSAENFGAERNLLKAEMPLRELMRDFFDEIKSATSGFASFSYNFAGWRPASLVRLDILLHGEAVAAFSRIVPGSSSGAEARKIVEKLYDILPREQFALKIQASASGRILASRTLPALRKDVTGYLYGGDRTRKMKLWQKQKKGKKRLKKMGRLNIPQEVFIKMIRPG